MLMRTTVQGHSALCALLCLLGPPRTAAGEDALASFGDVVPVAGQMQRTDRDFVDGLALDLFSPTNRTLVVTNNTSPLPGNFVAGSSGEGFVSLSKYSWIVKFNETAQDLIAKIELPYDPSALKEQGIDVSNTYVGTLTADGKSWLVSERQRNVHVSENKTRIIRMTSLDGEYMLLGRKSEDTANIFVQYGQGATRTVNATGGDRFNEAEFVDGLRFRIQTTQSFPLNVDIVNGVDKALLPEKTVPLNSFAWVVNSTSPGDNKLQAVIKFPYNQAMLASRAPGGTAKQLVVARRRLNPDATEQFQVVAKQKLAPSENRIKVSGMSEVDGQYVMLVRSSE